MWQHWFSQIHINFSKQNVVLTAWYLWLSRTTEMDTDGQQAECILSSVQKCIPASAVSCSIKEQGTAKSMTTKHILLLVVLYLYIYIYKEYVYNYRCKPFFLWISIQAGMSPVMYLRSWIRAASGPVCGDVLKQKMCCYTCWLEVLLLVSVPCAAFRSVDEYAGQPKEPYKNLTTCFSLFTGQEGYYNKLG